MASSEMNEIMQHLGTSVLVEYMNRQNGNRDPNFLATAAGQLEEITDTYVVVSGVGSGMSIPLAGPCSAVKSIRVLGGNREIYQNARVEEVYGAERFAPTDEQLDLVSKSGSWAKDK